MRKASFSAATVVTATLVAIFGVARAANVSAPTLAKKTYTKATVTWPKLSATSVYAFALTCGQTTNVCATVTPARIAPKFSWADPAGVLAITAGTDPSCNGGKGGFLTVGGPATGCTAGKQTIAAKLNGKTVSTAQGAIVDVVGTLTPEDNFSGRNQDKYGIAEKVTLGSTLTPSDVTPADIGGLQWSFSGVGNISNPPNDGTGKYAAGPTAGNVTLQLQGIAGPGASISKSYAKTVTAPTGNYQAMIPGTVVGHLSGTVSVGFETNFYILPMDVSFKNIMAREGSDGPFVSSGIYASAGVPHPISSWFPISNCNISTGCQWQNVFSTGPQPDFAAMCPRLPVTDNTGDFLWTIPNDYMVGTTIVLGYATIIQHGTSNAAGLNCISKDGVGPSCKAVADANAQTDVFGLCH